MTWRRRPACEFTGVPAPWRFERRDAVRTCSRDDRALPGLPSAASKSRPADKIKKANQLYADAVKGNAQVTLVETWPLFADANGDAIPAEFPDLLHPNLAGYAKWAAALRPIFATLGFLETEPYQFTPEPGFVSLFNVTAQFSYTRSEVGTVVAAN